MILYILGMASGFEALFLLLPVLVSVIYGEDVLSSYLISCVICAVFCDFFSGVLCRLPKSPHQPHSQDDPRIITGLPHHGQFILRSPSFMIQK